MLSPSLSRPHVPTHGIKERRERERERSGEERREKKRREEKWFVPSESEEDVSCVHFYDDVYVAASNEDREKEKERKREKDRRR